MMGTRLLFGKDDNESVELWRSGEDKELMSV